MFTLAAGLPNIGIDFNTLISLFSGKLGATVGIVIGLMLTFHLVKRSLSWSKKVGASRESDEYYESVIDDLNRRGRTVYVAPQSRGRTQMSYYKSSFRPHYKRPYYNRRNYRRRSY